MIKKIVSHLERAAELQMRADKIMDELQIRRRWDSVGKTVFVGSASFGLMTTPNLDFEIYVEEPDIRTGFDAIREFATVSGVEQIQFNNFMGSSDPGLYWRIDYRDRQGVLWDIDNWLVPYSHPYAGMAENFAKAMKQVLTDEAREIILDIKAQRTPENKFRGIDVYKAVLSGGVQNIEQFKEWRESNPVVEMETWRPSAHEQIDSVLIPK